MDKLEKQLKQVLGKNGLFDADKSKTLRKEVKQMIFQKFEGDMSRVKVVFWIFLVISAAMMVGGMLFINHEKGTRGMIFAAVITLIGYNSTILMKLWYWVVSTKLNILKEIKQLQLQIAELTGKEPPSEN
jgi:hypothetical protein